ncbi:hypothetical protein DH86_00003904, partial [Scytalidium sp. 3C]
MSDSEPLVLTDRDLNLNYKVAFTDNISPFSIEVDDAFLNTTRLKASLTRFVDDLEDQPEFTDGPPRHQVEKIAEYWAREYDWRKIESEINSRFNQYTTLVQTSSSPSYTDPIPLHFVHHRSQRQDAIPLLFVHGWPGSFLEVENIIESLTNPPDNTLPAFHVVAPSIPGFAFSPTPRKPGIGYRQAGAVFHALMQKLGYSKFVFQGGDAGDFINRYMAVDFPDAVVAGLSNFWVIPPTQADLDRYATGIADADEAYTIEHHTTFVNDRWSYGQLHQTRPLKLAVGLTDSPVGLAMWIYDLIRLSVNDPTLWTPERIITWTMMHWINGPYGGFSLYKNGRKDGAISTTGINLLPYVPQPVAISEFPRDIWYRTPLEWAR